MQQTVNPTSANQQREEGAGQVFREGAEGRGMVGAQQLRQSLLGHLDWPLGFH